MLNVWAVVEGVEGKNNIRAIAFSEEEAKKLLKKIAKRLDLTSEHIAFKVIRIEEWKI